MGNSYLAKKGVSLVTVLIFMMIATIAATATYKWISSTGLTSADRMAMSEAKEASHAGLESVRAWMTYHANDVGAIIRQYYDGDKKPIALTNIVRSMNSSKQVFKVWLTGVEASGSSYKFTIVSNGIARGNAKYSETSVLNVRGLYKVKEPSAVVKKPVNYKQSYFGGTTEGTQDVQNSSMIINGNWSGNPPKVDGDFVVTGNVGLSGSSLNLGKRVCVGGNLNIQNEGIKAVDLHIKGTATGFNAVVSGNAVFDKNVRISNAGGNQGSSFAKDVTLKATLYTEKTMPFTVSGNLCLENNGKIDVQQEYQKTFKVSKNVKIKNGDAFLNYPGPSNNIVSNMQLGGSGYSIYMPNLTTCTSNDRPIQGCKSGRKAQNYDFFTSAATATNIATPQMDCDTSIVTFCDSILGKPKKGCAGSNYKIDDVITTAYDAFSKLADQVSCAKIEGVNGPYQMSRLKNCYNQTPPNKMYHGYLVVKLHGSGDNSIFKDPQGTLEGNYIFIADTKFSMLKFPPTSANTNVFVYLANGAGTVNTSNASGKHNYFIYSKKDIDWLENSSPGKNWDGSFYLTADNCSKIGKINQGYQHINFNEKLMQDLIDSSVICGYDEFGSCGSLTNESADDTNREGEELNKEAGYDRFYVATAPQLSITLESQRRNKEILYDNLTSKQYTTVKPSIVILPRIAYLSDTPAGKLSDYFKLINLNGARETYSSNNVKCTPNLDKNDNQTLYTSKPLSSPVYWCEYTATNKSYGTIPFWVVVDAEAGAKSAVSFTESSTRIFGGGTVNVKIETDGNQREPVQAQVRVTEVHSGWTVTKVGSHVTLLANEDDGSKIYSVTLQPGTVTDIFRVKVQDAAENDQIHFEILSVTDNARIGLVPNETVWLVGAATVKREDIPETGFCDNNGHKEINGVDCRSIIQRPTCEGNLVAAAAGEWIRPNCTEPSTQEPNNKWICGIANPEAVKLQSRTISPYCDVFIPDSSIATLRDGQTYTLYASYKAKLFNLKVFLDGATSSKVEVRNSKQIIDETTPESAITKRTCNAGDTCRISVYAGEHVELRRIEEAGEQFNQWLFMRSDGTVEDNLTSWKVPVSLLHDTTVVAQFNQPENHCFYADFKDVEIWCGPGSSNKCIDKCTSSGKGLSCKVDGDGNYPKSEWLVTRTNDGQTFSPPSKQGEFIYYSNGKNANSSNASITYLLNRAQAGGHGTLTSRFKACFREKKGNNYSPLNSGFMLRSNDNASQYAIIQIYGRASQVNNVGSDVLEVRVCTGNGSGIKNENSGNCDHTTIPNITISKGDVPNIVFNTDIEVFGDSAKVKISYKKNDGTWVRSSVNVKLPVGANIDEYVGLSMADDCFKVMNLGWLSDDWESENCFDVPQVSCSFAAHYLGGILPLNEDVKPWVGTSSYFSDANNPDKLRPGCSIIYHYNGCDLAGGYGKNTCEKWLDGTTHCGSCSADSDGPYYVSGVNANTLRNEKYKFTYAGLHGMTKTYDYNGTTISGAVRDASVVVDCSNTGGNGHTYEATCGRFMVGSINECSQGASFNLSNCNNQNSCVVNVTGGIANLRSSSILGEIKGLPENDGSGSQPTVTMVMNDANGLKSQEFRISGNGMFSREVNLMSDMQEFDPEKVVSIEFSSSNDFTISSLSSDCPNSVGIHGCTAELNGDHFLISSNIVNAGSATCKVNGVNNSYKTDEKDCSVDGKFYIPAVDLQKNINLSGGSRSFTFTVTTKSKDNGEEETCTTPAITVQPNELTCALSSTTPINPGENLPSLNYKVTNCPPSGCLIEARVGSQPPMDLLYQGNGQVNSWSPNINTTPGNYRYTLTYAGLSCTADITVVTGANGSRADNCAIDEANKRFTADLNLAVGSTNNLKLWYLDKLGNTVGSSKSVSPSTTSFSEPLPAIAEAGDYIIVLSINGEEACSVQYTYTEEEPAEEAQCYIEGGRFKTRNKNTTGNTLYGVALNRNTDGATYGDGVGSTSWPDGGYIDMDAYVPTTPGTYTYNLWYSGNVLCSVTYEVKDETEENP